MTTPNVTPAQIISTILAVVGLFATQGLISNDTEKVIGGLAAILIPVAWQLADAIIRHGRSRALTPVATPALPPPPPSPAVVKRARTKRPS